MLDNDFIEIFPVGDNVGVNAITPARVKASLAAKLVKTKLWSYTPKPKNEKDVNLFIGKAKAEISDEMAKLEAERAKLIREREEFEAQRAESLTSGRGRKKAEV